MDLFANEPLECVASLCRDLGGVNAENLDRWQLTDVFGANQLVLGSAAGILNERSEVDRRIARRSLPYRRGRHDDVLTFTVAAVRAKQVRSRS
jgi:hypothetical protein